MHVSVCCTTNVNEEPGIGLFWAIPVVSRYFRYQLSTLTVKLNSHSTRRGYVTDTDSALTANKCYTLVTRLPSNLRPTTLECVHFVTRGYFLLRGKDGGHPIQSVISFHRRMSINTTKGNQ